MKSADGFIFKFFRALEGFGKKILFFLLFLVLYSFSFAQEIKVTARLDTNQISIGEQFGMNLSVTAPEGIIIFFPAIPDTIKKLEVVQRSEIDTLKSPDGKSTTLQQKFTLTCFDSGYYVIEPITFYFQNPGKPDTDSVSTEAQLLTVTTIPVDTTKAIKDIKPPLDVPFTLKEAVPYIIGAMAIILLIILVLYFMKKMKKEVVEIKHQIPDRPAHEIALEQLKKTEAEKLWQHGYVKTYHSRVADILRAYIEHRFSINAMELTSDETLERFKGKGLIRDEAKVKLEYILRLADMVKFAKVQPLPNENEQLMNDAYGFIMLTKPVTPEDFKENGKEAAA